LIATGANRSAKLWPPQYWRELVDWCSKQELSVGLLGSKPSEQARYYHSADAESVLLRETALLDLRGRYTLPEVSGALQRARACVTIDNGIMHLAGAVGTPTVAIFGGSPWRLWAPRNPSVRTLLPAEPCTRCEENRFRNESCLLPQQICLLSVSPARVASALAAMLAAGTPG
jgi:ADP-heptose:LPS heptosyltransferase